MIAAPFGSVQVRPIAKAVILTALGLEYEAVVSLLAGRTTQRFPGGTIYEIGRFEGDNIDWEVAVAEIGPGNVGAAIEATKAIAELGPNLLMFVGVAGSLKPDDAPLGSVVVADSVYGYEAGKDSSDFVPRPVQLRTWHELSQLVKAVARSGWSGSDEVPVLVRPVAAGNKLVGSSRSRTYELIRSHYGDATAVEMESLGLYLAAERSQRLPVLSVRGISDCIDDKTATADKVWQPIAAGNAAGFAFATLSAMVPEDIGNALTTSGEKSPGEAARNWSSIPFSVAELLQKTQDVRPAATSSLLEVLAEGRSDSRGALEILLHKSPKWLMDANSDLMWAAVAEFASAHGIHDLAAEAYRRAGESSAGTGPWQVLAALEASATVGVEEALGRLDEANESHELSKGLARALILNDVAGVIDATEGVDGTDARAGAYRVSALWSEDRVSEAIDLAQRVLSHHPGAAGSAILLGKLLLQVAHSGTSPLGYDASLLKARELALTARDLRRGWGGDSVEPTIVAGHASIMLRDPLVALNVSSCPDEGSALPIEAADESVLRIRVDALMLLGRYRDALSESADLADEVTRKLMQADCVCALGDTGRAGELYLEALGALEDAAVESAEIPRQIFHGLIGLAELGEELPPKALGLLRALNPEAATKVDIFLEIRRGETALAMKRAREGGSPGDVDMLVQALLKAGQPDDAMSVLRDAATRLGRDEYLLEIVRILGRERRFSEGYTEAVDSLAVAAEGTRVKAELRVAAADMASRMGDWGAMLRHAKAAVAAGDSSEGMRWALVVALNNTMEPESALTEATREPALKPRSEEEARLLISLHYLRGSGLASVAAVLDMAEAYPDSEEVGAAAVGCIIMLAKDCDLPEDTRLRVVKSSEDFFTQHPDSSHLMRVEASPETMLEMLRAAGDPWNAPEVQELIEQVRRGTLPLSLLAEVSKKPYSELLVKRGIGSIVGESTNLAVRDNEREHATRSIGRPVTVETSAVVGAMATELPLDALFGLFPQIVAAQVSVEDAIRGASNLALRSTTSMYWDSLQGKGVLDERTPDEVDQWARDASVIELTLRGASSRVACDGMVETDTTLLTLQPIRVAKELGLPLYSDDVAIRMLAASEGVPSFGTASLIAASESSGALTPEQAYLAMNALRRNHYADLSWSPEDVERVCEQEGLSPSGGVAGAISRPNFWADPSAATEMYRSILQQLIETGAEPQVVEGWHAAATLGFLGASPPLSRRRVGGGLLAAALLRFGLRSVALPPLLAGARQGAAARGVDDVLPDFCRAIIRALAGVCGEAQGARIFVEMMQQLSPQDRAVAMRELIAGRAVQPNEANEGT